MCVDDVARNANAIGARGLLRALAKVFGGHITYAFANVRGLHLQLYKCPQLLN